MKKNLAVIFGGRSSEHEVSCVSVVTIAKAVDLEKYNMFLIGITKDGEWKLVEDIASIEDGSWKESPVSAIISPDTKGGLIISQDDMMKVRNLGRKSLDEVINKLQSLGLSLRDEEE